MNLFKPWKKKSIDIEPSAPPYYQEKFQKLIDRNMVCQWKTL